VLALRDWQPARTAAPFEKMRSVVARIQLATELQIPAVTIAESRTMERDS
jgi:hypothetical protein